MIDRELFMFPSAAVVFFSEVFPSLADVISLEGELSIPKCHANVFALALAKKKQANNY